MRGAGIAALALLLLTGCKKDRQSQVAPAVPILKRTYDLCLRHSVLTSISDAESDDILLRATTVLHEQAYPACQAVAMSREGPVASLAADLPDQIITSEDFRRVIANHCVNVVRKILWCGEKLALKGGALGCAPILGEGAAVVRTYDNMPEKDEHSVEPITWLHELGHNHGLVHSGTARDVMYIGLASSTNRISAPECAIYDGVMRAQGHSRIDVGEPAAPPRPNGRVPEPMYAFVKRASTGPFPVDEAKAYGGQEQQALALLDDPAFEPYQSSVVALLGVIGTRTAIPRLTHMLFDLVSTSTRESHVDALLAAPIAIGAIANRYRLPPRDFDILREAAKPGYWKQRVVLANPAKTGIGGLTPEQVDQRRVDDLVRELSSQTLKGYALTGHAGLDLTFEANSSQIAIAKQISSSEKSDRIAQIRDALSLHSISRSLGALTVLR
jgi:hypothetical protein